MNLEPHAVSEKAADAVLTDRSIVGDHLLCQQCKKIAVNCYQTRHGCRLCKACVLNWQQQCDSAKNCPCGDDERTDLSDECLIGRAPCVPDTGGRREVNDLEVLCPNRGLGCSHACKIRHVDKHLTTNCDFEKTKCDLCQQEVLLYRLDSHHKDLRSESCCSRFRAPCPHCNNTCLLDRQAFLSHKESVCPCAPIACPFSSCEWTGCRQELEQHQKDSIVPHQLLMHSSCSSNDARLKVVEDHLSKQQASTSHASPDTQRENVVENRRDLGHEIANLSSEEVGNVAASSNDSFSLEQALRLYLTDQDCEQVLLGIFAQNPELIRSALLTEAHTGDSENERIRKLTALADRQNPASIPGHTPVHRHSPQKLEVQNVGQPAAHSEDRATQRGNRDIGIAASDYQVENASLITLRRLRQSRPSQTRMSAPPMIGDFCTTEYSF